MDVRPLGRRSVGKVSARDALVFAVIALVVLVLIEGIIISNATASAGTSTEVSTVTYLDPGGNASTVTVFSNQTTTVTSSIPGSNITRTVTTTTTEGPGIPITVTLTVTSTGSGNTTTLTSTSTETSTTTQTSTSTVTSTTTVTPRAYVVIPPGTSTSGGASKGFDPDLITVVIGVNATVIWINDDTVNHTVTSTSAVEPFDSGQIAPGGTFVFSFTVPGNYTYVCQDYPWMSGAVVVEPRGTQ